MKKKISAWMVIGYLLIGTAAFAADGDFIVNGNVGIGTTVPTSKLQIGIDTGGGSSYITIGKGWDSASGINWRRSGVVDSSIYSDASENLIFETDMTNAIGNGNFIFRSNGGSELARIATNGFVGIGTASPSSNLHVIGNIMASRPSGDTNSVLLQLYQNNVAGSQGQWLLASRNDTTLGFYNATSGDVMTLLPNGTVGINGFQNPGYTVQVNGSFAVNGLKAFEAHREVVWVK